VLNIQKSIIFILPLTVLTACMSPTNEGTGNTGGGTPTTYDWYYTDNGNGTITVTLNDGSGESVTVTPAYQLNGSTQYATIAVHGQNVNPLALETDDTNLILIPSVGAYDQTLAASSNFDTQFTSSATFTGRYLETVGSGLQSGNATISVDFDAGTMSVLGPDALNGLTMSWSASSESFVVTNGTVQAEGTVYGDTDAGGQYSDSSTSTQGIFLGTK
jgi:hypothetical protein